MTATAHIFIGPSGRGLALPLGREHVVVHPPIGHGDLLRLDLRDGDVVGIVDGYFYSAPAIRHGEILTAVGRGARVVGGASMGALRAADLLGSGMEGVGVVYDWLRRGVIDADHEVALLHGDQSTGYQPQSVALVTLRWCLGVLVDAGALPPAAAARVIELIASMWFGDRTVRAVAQSCEDSGLEPPATAQLMDRLRHGPDIKTSDAGEVIIRCLELADPAGEPEPGGGWQPHRLDLHQLWSREVAFGGASTAALRRHLALQAIQLFHRSTPALVATVVRGLLAQEWGVDDDTASLAAGFRAQTGLDHVSAARRQAWLWPEHRPTGDDGTGDDDLVRLAVASYRTAPSLPPWAALERHVGELVDLDSLGATVDALLAARTAKSVQPARVLGRVGLLWGCGPDAAALRRVGYSRAFRDLGELFHAAGHVVGTDIEAGVRQAVDRALPVSGDRQARPAA